jgi:hypothetical protein
MSNVFIVQDGKSYPIGGGSSPKQDKAIPKGVSDDRSAAKRDVHAMVESIDEQLTSMNEQLKIIRQTLHESSPYLKRATDVDGQVRSDKVGGES